MGFDFTIQLVLHICPATGNPFVYATSSEKTYKEYSLSDIMIPEKYRRFCEERGSIFHAYTHTLSYHDVYSVDISRLLEEFPDWDTVLHSDWYDEDDDGWSEKDHDDFKEALVWFSEQPYRFQASWSY